MNCKQVQKQLKAYLDKELPESVAEQVSRHTRSCPSCAQEAETLAKTWDLLLELPEARDVPDLIPTTLARITTEQEQSLLDKIGRWFVPVPVPALAATALVIGLFIGIGLGNIISTNYLEVRQTEDPLYLEVFHDVPPDSVGDAYIKVNYVKGDENV